MRTTCAFAIVLLILLGAPALGGAACGNGVREGDEDCDGADLGGKSCKSLTGGFVQGGTLTCNADCTFNTDDCRRAFIESLVPSQAGGKNRCQLEMGTVGTTTKGGPTKRFCIDGDDTCDDDRSFNNSCAFVVQLCLNVPDGRVAGCTAPGRIFRVQVLQPTGSSDLAQKTQRAMVEAATGLAVAAGISASTNGNSVSFSPPVTDFSCGMTTVTVPLRGTTGKARPGKVRLKARSTDNSGRVRATGVLTLTCNP